MKLLDLYYISPEISMIAWGGMLLILDLFLKRKGILGNFAVIGLILPVGLCVALWLDVGGASSELSGLFGTIIVDKFSLFFKFLFLLAVGLTILASQDYLKKFVSAQGEYYCLLFFCSAGMMLLVSSIELISIYISLELMALPLAALAAFRKTYRSTEAGLKFLILSAMSSAIILYGMAFVYGATGSTWLPDITASLIASSPTHTVSFGSYALLISMVFLLGGLGFKLAAVPFHMWVPDVYEGSPTPITAFLSVASKAAGFAIVLRIFYAIYANLDIDWGFVFAVISVLSMTVGNIVAIIQTNIKRMLAYSTIAHAGYILIGVAAFSSDITGADPAGPSGVLFYLWAYGLTSLAAFYVLIAVSGSSDDERIGSFAGLSSRSPWLAFLLVVSLVSLTGLPPTAGFIAKLYIFNAAVNNGLTWLAMVGLGNSVLSAYYYLRVVKVAYTSQPTSKERIYVSRPMCLALIITAAGILLVGVLPYSLSMVTDSVSKAFVDTLANVSFVQQ